MSSDAEMLRESLMRMREQEAEKTRQEDNERDTKRMKVESPLLKVAYSIVDNFQALRIKSHPELEEKRVEIMEIFLWIPLSPEYEGIRPKERVNLTSARVYK